MQRGIHQNFFLINIWRHLSVKRKKQFFVLIFLSIVTSISEGFSLGSLIPFIGIIVNPELFMKSPYMDYISSLFNFNNSSDLVILIIIIFGSVALITCILRMMLLKYSTYLGNNIGADFSAKIFKLTLYQPYDVHIERSSSEVISGITQKLSTLTSVLISLVAVFSLLFLFISFTATLLLVNLQITIISLLSFAIVYSIIILYSRKRLVLNSTILSSSHQVVLKDLQESLGAIRDVLLDGTQDEYCQNYNRSVIDLQNANSSNIFLNQAPRFILESFAMILISTIILVYHLLAIDAIVILPSLTVLALGSQRLLPVMNSIYGNYSNFKGNIQSIFDVMELLNQEIPSRNFHNNLISFNNKLEIKNIHFRYKSSPKLILNNVNIVIKKGSRVGFIGSTGSGKSTLFDVIMGLLNPTIGNLILDDTVICEENILAYQKIISHVPQFIFLADKSIQENIAFGIPKNEIDLNRVKEAANMAMLSDFINSMHDGYNTNVGERGVKLSGGQRQRIGIARALYKKSEILIFDEATSALDSSTELEVMDTIDKLGNNLTILMIAHRITTLKKCDIIYKIQDGKVLNGNSYHEIIN